MIINTYKQYLFKKFSKKILLISGIFFILVLIINLIEESNFIKDSETTFLTPVMLTVLNGPSLLYEMFPFIFLISTQFFFIDIYENREIDTLRLFGVNNFSLLKFLIITSLIFGFFLIFIFYNFSSILKNEYLKIKNNYADDNKYLAVITKNGIWIKDTFEEGVVIINADKIIDEFLINSSITKLDKIVLKSNSDLERINNLFSDLSSLTYFELLKLEKDYISIGYSTDEINIQKHKFYSLPILLCIMTIIGTIIMIHNKFKKNLLLNLFIGIFFSVTVYYLSHFSNLLGENGRFPLILSVWFPIIILLSVSTIGIIRLNEK